MIPHREIHYLKKYEFVHIMAVTLHQDIFGIFVGWKLFFMWIFYCFANFFLGNILITSGNELYNSTDLWRKEFAVLADNVLYFTDGFLTSHFISDRVIV